MGFENVVRHQEMTKNLLEDFKKRLNNPFYIYNEKKQTLVTYFNINTDQSTTDPGLHTHSSNLGDQSPLMFNQIDDTYLYGISGAELGAEYGDFGVEASDITGEAYVLPNTFTPRENDYFSINYLDKDLLFKVTKVTPDTLPNGANFFKLEYKLDQHGWEEGDIYDQVVGKFVMDVTNFGTDEKVIIKKEEYDFVTSMKELIGQLQSYYIDMYYDSAVQTFIFIKDCAHFYDPYMVEFLKRNEVLSSGKFIYIDHRTSLSNMFKIQYDKTVFKALELKSLEKLKKYNNPFCGIAVEDPTSLLSTRYDTYYQMTYSKYALLTTVGQFATIDVDPFSHIVDNVKYEDDENKIYNILVRYFNNENVRTDLVDILDNIDYCPSKDLFYMIPMILFIMNKEVHDTLSNAA